MPLLLVFTFSLSEAIISCASIDPRLIAFLDDSTFASAGQSAATVAGVSAPDAQS
jgi:hypothetical protein